MQLFGQLGCKSPKARESAGVDLFPGLDTRNSGKLRGILLNYFDSIHKTVGLGASPMVDRINMTTTLL